MSVHRLLPSEKITSSIDFRSAWIKPSDAVLIQHGPNYTYHLGIFHRPLNSAEYSTSLNIICLYKGYWDHSILGIVPENNRVNMVSLCNKIILLREHLLNDLLHPVKTRIEIHDIDPRKLCAAL